MGVLRLDGVESRNGDWRLGPVDLDLAQGCVALVGVNGAGKSTLIRTVVGLQIPVSGRVVINGTPVMTADDRRRAGAGIGYLPQDMRLPMSATVSQALKYYAWLKGVERHGVENRMQRVLDLVDLGDRRGTKVRSLSGGQRQRLALATAMVHGPDLMVLDEPTAGLDPLQRVETRQRLREEARGGLMLLSTHLAEDVSALADYVVVIHDGEVRFQGTRTSLEQLAQTDDPGLSRTEQALWRLLGGRA